LDDIEPKVDKMKRSRKKQWRLIGAELAISEFIVSIAANEMRQSSLWTNLWTKSIKKISSRFALKDRWVGKSRRLMRSGAAITVVVYLALPAPVLAADPNASVETGDMTVSVVAVQKSCFSDTLEVSGVLIPKSDILVWPEREGMQVSQILVEAGDNVSSGQVLARLISFEGQSPTTNSVVVAPSTGTIISVRAVVGMLASARAEPLFRIAARGEIELLADAPTKSLARITPGQSAEIEIIGVGTLSGAVRLVSSTISETTQLAQIHVLLNNDSRLRVGAFGHAKIDLGKRCGPSVPLSAVLYGTQGTVVQIVRDGRVETRPVTVGLLADGLTEVREGISVDEVVVARAGTFVRDGDRIRAVKTGNPQPR
jgi:HlyD family secretion protein